MQPNPNPDQDARARLGRIADAHLRAEHDGDLEAILAPLAHGIVHDTVGSTENPIRGLDAVRGHYRDQLAVMIHERDVPLRRLFGPDFVVDEHLWQGRLTGRAFELDGHGRWVSYRVLSVLEVRDDRIVRQTVWNDLAAIRRQLR
jgi:predicted ester cyclase